MSQIRFNGNVFSLSAGTQLGVLGVATSTTAANNDFIIVQSKEPLTRPQKSELKGLHIQFQEYMSGNAWLCKYEPADLHAIRKLPYIHKVDIVPPEYKLQPALKSRSASSGTCQVDVVLHQQANASATEIAQRIQDLTGIEAEKMEMRHDDNIVRLVVEDPKKLAAIAKIDDIASIQEVRQLQLHNNIARNILHADVEINVTSYKGKGQVITVADTGFDTGCLNDTHPAFSSRVLGLVPIGRDTETNDENGHGTHVCGSALGDGASAILGGPIRGTAPEASLVVQALLGYPDPDEDNKRFLFGKSGKSLSFLLQDAYDNHASRIHTNSWGPGWDFDTQKQAPYGNAGGDLDDFVWNNKSLVVCFAAGNDGEQPKRSPGHVGGQASAKNCITVGSCNNRRPAKDAKFEQFDAKGEKIGNPEDVSVFSSRGPTLERRIKPDLIAPGSMILSAASRNAPQQTAFGTCDDSLWMFDTGTSMSTPLVAGCAAVLRQILIDGGLNDPSAALIKALLINGARSLGRPVEEQGFGRVDLANSVIRKGATPARDFIEGEIHDADGLDVFVKGFRLGEYTKTTNVTLKATLVYMDQASEVLQNNLNLIVHNGNRKRHGNGGDTEDVDFYDTNNNVEQVVWKGLQPDDDIQLEVSTREAMIADTVPFALVWSVLEEGK